MLLLTLLNTNAGIFPLDIVSADKILKMDEEAVVDEFDLVIFDDDDRVL